MELEELVWLYLIMGFGVSVGINMFFIVQHFFGKKLDRWLENE